MSKPNPNAKTRPGVKPNVDVRINRSAYINWSMIATVILLTAISLASVLAPVFSERSSGGVWTFSKPQITLIICLSLTLILLAGLAHQQRYLGMLRAQFELNQKAEKERAERHTARLYALLNVGRVIAASSDLQHVFDSIAKLCCDAFNCDQASLMLFDADSNSLEVRAASGKNVPADMLGTRQPIGTGIAGWVAQKREPLLLTPGMPPVPGLELRKKEMSAAMIMPVILRDELVGVLNVSSRSQTVKFDADDMRALQAFAENVGAAIRHAEQADWMRATIRKLQGQKDRHATGQHPAYPAKPAGSDT